MSTKILLAEDEAALGMIVKESLESRGFSVQWCEDGEAAWQAYQHQPPHVLVLDVMMPARDGFSLARMIRKKDKKTPILFLTAKSQTQDVVEGFDLGGNDYLKKPFSMEELIVRIKELAQRADRRMAFETLEIGQYTFNYPKQSLSINGEEQPLTHREAEVLQRLASKPNELFDRAIMLEEVWGTEDFFNARSMDVFITKLRKKLSQDPNVQIVNVRGYGYKLIC